jgi:FkbM family methyltransferase
MSQTWRERRELARLASLPRYRPTTTRLLGPELHLADTHSFLAQYRAIFQRQRLAFKCGRPDPVVFDCGANVGLVTIYWKQIYPHARVTAFEPDPILFRLLSRNVIAFKITDVALFEAAVWIRNEVLPFLIEGADAGRLVNSPPEGATIRPVRAVRLRDFLDGPVDMLKIDVEGAEVDILLDCEDRLHLVNRIMVEYHSEEDRPQRLDEVLTTLRSAGFRFHLSTEYAARQPFISRPSNVGFDFQVDIFAFRP